MQDTTLTPPPLPLDLPSIITRYLAGASMLELAKDSPVSVRTLYRYILKELGPKYREAQQECLTNRIADADMMILESTDNWQVSRAREVARFARMDYERRFPGEYGLKQEA